MQAQLTADLVETGCPQHGAATMELTPEGFFCRPCDALAAAEEIGFEHGCLDGGMWSTPSPLIAELARTDPETATRPDLRDALWAAYVSGNLDGSR